MSLVSFIVPTIEGRQEQLATAVGSLLAQSDPDWDAVVVGDGFWPKEHPDSRVRSLQGRRERSAGLTRNQGLGLVTGRWTGFLDDDDTLSPDYVKWLKGAEPVDEGVGVVVFRMLHPELGILPSLESPEIEWGQVGVSFAVRTALLDGVEFIREEYPDDLGKAVNEDIALLKELEGNGARLLLRDEIAYFVGGVS